MNPWLNVESWVLVFHVAGIVMWIGGLFYALSVSRAGGGSTDTPSARAQRAELANKAMRALAHPGAAITILAGLYLFYLLPAVRMAPWLHVKLLLVLLLIVCDIVLTVRVRRMPEQEMKPKQMRALHGSIALLFFLILIMVLVRPF
ncbi:MAG: CopD family protein [Terriglobales bacterium]